MIEYDEAYGVVSCGGRTVGQLGWWFTEYKLFYGARTLHFDTVADALAWVEADQRERFPFYFR